MEHGDLHIEGHRSCRRNLSHDGSYSTEERRK
jgi:hypothetical protein